MVVSGGCLLVVETNEAGMLLMGKELGKYIGAGKVWQADENAGTRYGRAGLKRSGVCPAWAPASAGVTWLDLGTVLQRSHSRESGNPRVFTQALKPCPSEATGIYSDFWIDNSKCYEQTQHVGENKDGVFEEPSIPLKTKALPSLTQHVIDSAMFNRSSQWQHHASMTGQRPANAN
jgi:hypothetical protein